MSMKKKLIALVVVKVALLAAIAVGVMLWIDGGKHGGNVAVAAQKAR